VIVEAFVAIGGTVGAVQLLTGTFTPPVKDLEPLGLTSWRLPACWLFATTALPAIAAVACAVRRSPRTPWAVLVASITLAVELLVQIPYVGPSVLQAVMGAIALSMGVLAERERTEGRWQVSAAR
jgi:hypothetical protein